MTNPALATTTKDGRYYEWQREKYPSVTTILGTINKPALATWAKGLVVKSLPSRIGPIVQSLVHGGWDAVAKELRLIPDQERDRAAALGTAVHEATERLDRGEPVLTDSNTEDYVHSYRKFLAECSPEWEDIEATVFSRSKYAGTVDRIGLINGERWLIDLKSGKSVWPESCLQVAAYAAADWLGGPKGQELPLPVIDQLGILHLRPDSWRLLRVTDRAGAEEAWTCLLGVYEYLQTHKNPYEEVTGSG